MIFRKNCINDFANCNIVRTLQFFQLKNVSLTFDNE